jgi:hypothetical protein
MPCSWRLLAYSYWGINMKQKGQAAIEFIMLILIVLIYLLTITRPLILDAKNHTEDVQTIVRADAESKRIANSIIDVAMLGEGTKKTILLFVPENAEIRCDETKNAIGFDMNLSARPYPKINVTDAGACNQGSCCKEGACEKSYAFSNEIKLDCQKEIMKGESKVIIINDDVSAGVATISITG